MTEGSKHGTRIAVCVVTCERPTGLSRVLDSLAAQRLSPHVSLKVCIIDNDASGSAERVVNTFRTAQLCAKAEILYEIEPRRGIPFARNRAIELAGPDVDAVAFIDDDETAEPNWLQALIDAQRRTEADVVTGPALPAFAEGVLEGSEWIRTGRFFDLPSHADGAPLNQAYTNNVLVRAHVLKLNGSAFFDESVGAGGGSDSLAFARAAWKGARIIWCSTAVTHEWIPKSRACASWIVKRGFRVGNSRALLDRDLDTRILTVLRLLLTGCYRVAKGIGMLIVCCASKASRVRGARHCAYGSGMLLGVFGWRYAEYKRIHSSDNQ